MRTAILLPIFLAFSSVPAAEWTAAQLAEQMAAAVEDGDATARVRLNSAETGVLQVRIKSRRTAAESAVVYEILWPEERRGEAFVLRQSGTGAVRGTARTADGQTVPLGAADMNKPVFGTALVYADLIGNVFRWARQTLGGTEAMGKTTCLILDSSPGVQDAAAYGRVRSWIDPKRLVPLRVEKYDTSGRLLRQIDTTQVRKDDTGRQVPAGLTVRAGNRSTEIDGVNIRHDVQHAAADFAF
jgi:hypothetical protein